jgi:hypothetical protein
MCKKLDQYWPGDREAILPEQAIDAPLRHRLAIHRGVVQRHPEAATEHAGLRLLLLDSDGRCPAVGHGHAHAHGRARLCL